MLEWGVEPSVALPRVRWDRETADVEKKLAELKAAGAQSVLAGNTEATLNWPGGRVCACAETSGWRSTTPSAPGCTPDWAWSP